MQKEILKLLNDSNPEDAEYTGFTLLAQNADGVRMVTCNLSEFDLMLQTMVLIRECKMDDTPKGDRDVRH